MAVPPPYEEAAFFVTRFSSSHGLADLCSRTGHTGEWLARAELFWYLLAYRSWAWFSACLRDGYICDGRWFVADIHGGSLALNLVTP